MKSILIEIKNSLEVFNIGSEQAEEIFSETENISIKTIHPNRKEKRLKKNEQNPRDLWDTIKYTHISLMGVLEGEV